MVQNAYTSGDFNTAHGTLEGYNEAVTIHPDGTSYDCPLN
jgi:hypothetical protein